VPKTIYHTHHIIPVHAGGTDDPSNLVRLTIEEHAEAHRLLWEQYGRLGDKVAWLMLSGRTEEGEQARRELIKEALARPEVKAKMRAKAQNRTPEHQAKLAASLRGHKQTPEHIEKSSAKRRGRILNGWNDRSEEERKAWTRLINTSRQKKWDETPLEVRQEMSRQMNERNVELGTWKKGVEKARLVNTGKKVDPELVARRAATQRDFNQTPEGQKAIAERTAKLKATNQRKRELGQAQTRSLEVRQKTAAAVRAYNQTPEGQLALIERGRKVRETKARKKAEQEAAKTAAGEK
jgi:hypothetical protein